MLFGCRHAWYTRSFSHTAHGPIYINVCANCGERHPWFAWDGRYW